MPLQTDYLIVGAGLSGLVLAERLTTQLGKRCLVVERRGHIGGNSQDEYDAAGVLVHKYGPHYFRTDSARVKDYLSQFTEWHPVDYQILSWARGRYWNFPINLNTFEQLIDRPSSEAEFQDYLRAKRVPIAEPANSEEVILSQVGEEFYELFFKGYTEKQWQMPPRDLAPSLCLRIPIRTNRDDRYLRETFQALPKLGYHKMFERMVAAANGVQMMLNTDYREVLPQVQYEHLVYTGPIDEFYDHRFGTLPYRSLRFESESFSPEQLSARESIAGKKGFWQPAMQVNYPDEQDFTRIVEIKHATGQSIPQTTIVREYPQNYIAGREPYYPIPTAAAQTLYRQYAELASRETNVTFLGRLATYSYHNMDQVVALALAEFDRLKSLNA